MRILVANKFSSPVGGVETHVSFVSDWLEGLGHQVIPFSMQEVGISEGPYARYFPSQVEFGSSQPREVMRGLERATRSAETRRKLSQLMNDEPIDAAYVVHVYHQLGTVVLNDLVDRGIPTVLSLHDYKIGCPNYRFFSERTGRVCTRCLDHKYNALWAPAVERCWKGSTFAGAALSLEAAFTRTRRSYRQPGSVTVLNALQERAAVFAGVDPARIHRVAHPVALREPTSSARTQALLYVGRLVPEKGVDVLIRAAALAGTPVKIAGSGRCEQDLRTLADELLAPVEFLGPVDGARVAHLMSQACALVVPSVWHEVSPLVVYEAFAADLPVIGSRVGGIIEQLGCDRGILVEPGNVPELADVMARVTKDKDLGRSLSSKARAYAQQNLTVDKWAADMASAFEGAGAEGVMP